MLRNTLLVMLLAVGFLAMPACSPEDMVKVKVPRDVQQKTGAPAEVTLSQFNDVKAAYEDSVRTELEANQAKAAAAARVLTKATKSTRAKYLAQIADLQRQAEAEIDALNDEADERHAEIDAASSALNNSFARTNTRLVALEKDAQAKAESLRSLVNFGFNEIAPSIAGQFPGVGLALPLLTGIGALFIKKPGTDKALAEAEARGYDMGASEARRHIREGAMIKPAAVEPSASA